MEPHVCRAEKKRWGERGSGLIAAVHDVDGLPVAAVPAETVFEFGKGERAFRETVAVDAQELQAFLGRKLEIEQRRVEIEQNNAGHLEFEPDAAARDVDEKDLHALRRVPAVQDIARMKRLVEEAALVHFRDLRREERAELPPHGDVLPESAAGHEIAAVAGILDELRHDERFHEFPVVFARLAECQNIGRRNAEAFDRLIVAPFAGGMRQVDDITARDLPLTGLPRHRAAAEFGGKRDFPDKFSGAVRKQIAFVPELGILLKICERPLKTRLAPVGGIEETKRLTPRRKRIGKD